MLNMISFALFFFIIGLIVSDILNGPSNNSFHEDLKGLKELQTLLDEKEEE